MKIFDWVPLIFDRVVVATVFASALAIGIAFLQWCFDARLNAAWRFCLWSVVMVRLLIPVFPQSPTSLFNLARLWNYNSTTNTAHHAPSAESPTRAPHHRLESEASSAPHLRSQSGDALNKGEILAFLWSIGAGLLLLRLLLGSIWLRLRLAREASVPNCRAESILVQVITPGKVSPTITETTLIESPSVFGCFRPRILMPTGLAEQFTDSQLRDVFIHEIGHIRRWDLWTNMLMSVAGALHWFNPIAWMVFRRMRIERELACDAIVLESTGPEGAKRYGQTLLAMFERLCPNRARSEVIGMLEEKQAARYRLAQIAGFNFQRGASRKIGIPLLAGAALIGLTDASERKSDPVVTSPNLTVLSTNALGYNIITSVTNLNFSMRKFDRILIPEFGVAKALPLSRVLVRLGDEMQKSDSNHSGLTFMIRSRSSLNHPRLDDFLVRVDPPLKNVRLAEICDAISSAARAPVDEFRTIKVAYSVEEDYVTFLEAELFNIEFVVDDISEAERLCKFLGDQGIEVFATSIEADNFLGTQIEFSRRGLFFKPGR